MSVVETHVPDLTRRRFLAGSAAWAATVAVTGFGPVRSFAHHSTAAASDGHGHEPILRLAGVIRAGSEYLAAAVVGDRFGLYELRTDGPQRESTEDGTGEEARRARLGGAVPLRLPDGLIWGELSLAEGRPILVGGLPSLWSVEEVDYHMPPEIARSMETMPGHVPTRGRREVRILGVEPAAYAVDPPNVTPIDLPARPRRLVSFAASAVEGPDGSFAILLAHSEDRDEGMYASGVEIVERAGGSWRVEQLAGDLGESGPHVLGRQEGRPVAVLSSSRGSRSLYARRRGRSRVPFEDEVVKGAGESMRGELRVYSASGDGGLRRWSQDRPDGPWTNEGLLAVEGEAVLDVFDVRGSDGEALLVGESAAWMVTQN